MATVIVHILISLVFYFVLMFLSVNLLGFFVRGLFTNPELDKLGKEGSDFIKKEVRSVQSADKWGNVVGIILIVVYFGVLFRIWNIGVVLAAVIIMLGRLPDLLWEIKNGKKTDARLMNKNAMYYVSTFFALGFVACTLFLSL